MIRRHFSFVVAASLVVVTAVAQSSEPALAQAQQGNRANGFNYQPTPGEVGPREKAAGIQAPADRQKANDRTLERIDRNLLHQEGQDAKRAPKFTTGQQP